MVIHLEPPPEAALRRATCLAVDVGAALGTVPPVQRSFGHGFKLLRAGAGGRQGDARKQRELHRDEDR